MKQIRKESIYEISLELISQCLLKVVSVELVIAVFPGSAIYIKMIIYLCILFCRCEKIMLM